MKATRSIKKAEVVNNWLLIDATGVRLGKLSTKVASLLLGKHKVNQTRNMVTGDHVVIVNADKLDVHASKLQKKVYYTHSGYISGLKKKTLEQQLEVDASKVITDAVWGMLPKNKLGEAIFVNLHVYNGAEHPHVAQQPQKIEIK